MNQAHSDSAPEIFAELAAALEPVAPQAARAAGMRDRVMAAATDGTEVVRQGEGEWVNVLPGVDIRCLRRDVATGSQTCLWRLAAGAAIPPHAHQSDEECLVLEGEIHHHGEVYRRGDYLLARAGTRQVQVLAPDGALLLIRGEIHG